ncbi:MAG: hypothetical protein JWM68_4161 [Verrucomicrobiales bacterium]|nr:hypothetical protein [Verrucomicrobiales bacterium]
MNSFQIRWPALICSLLLSVASSSALVIDVDTVIAPNVTNYESLDLVVTNCTLTVDGLETFANLQLLSGGVLTHSSSGSATITNIVTVTNELHSLSDTNPALLN